MVEYKNSKRGSKYALALAFVSLVPGSLLTALSHFQPLFLPRPVVEFLFPLAIAPVEKQAIVAMYNLLVSAGHTRMDPEVFDRLDIFGQQTFVVALLCFFLTLVIYYLKARAGALIAEPRLEMIPVFLIVVIVCIVMRDVFAYFLIASTGSIDPMSPARIAAAHPGAAAPLMLVLVSCTIAMSLGQLIRLFYLLLGARLR